MASPQLALAKEQMLRKHLRARGIHDPRVLAAMSRVPRESFVDPAMRDSAYADRAMAIPCGQTISQPYIVALMSQALQAAGDEKVLEIGTGSGYQTAILAELTREVVSVERHADLMEQARARLIQFGYQNVALVHGDGTQGWPEGAPYARIVVTAAAPRCPPALWEQLAEGGILVIPLGGSEGQVLQAVRKVNGQPQVTALSQCRFVPLVGQQGWAE